MRRVGDAWGKGSLGEGVIARWLNSRGYSVIPAYEKEQDDYKGPRVYLPNGQLVAPDLFALITRKSGTFGMWVEAKTKDRFTWHWKTGRWQTGIDTRHFAEYQQLEQLHNLPVHLLFLHRFTEPSDDDRRRGCPDECPAGLFGQRLSALVACGQTSPGRGHYDRRSGQFKPMVYWNVEDLRRYATLDELEEVMRMPPDDDMRSAA